MMRSGLAAMGVIGSIAALVWGAANAKNNCVSLAMVRATIILTVLPPSLS
jgi:hypothetical protein